MAGRGAPSVHEALERIAAIVGERGMVAAGDADRYLVDERRRYRGAAALIVRPGSIEECAAVVRVCAQARIGVVPQGGNTGYCGGATPFDAERQILLSLVRLNRVREIDPVGFTMTVEAGVVLANAQAAAAERGLLLPLSMGSEGSCQIGGNLATNAGGLAVLRYGSARDLVLGLEVVTASGEVWSDLRGLRKDNTGYDLARLFVGSEGTLGVITAAVLKLYTAPCARQTAWVAVPSVAAACALFARARRDSGDQVVAAEYVSRGSLELVRRYVEGARDPLDGPYPHYLLLELASAQEDASLRVTLERTLADALAAGEAADGALADSLAQRAGFWQLRERVPEAEKRAGGALKHDVAVRVGAIPALIERGRAALAAIGPHRVSLFGHLGDGNLHFNVLPPDGGAAFSAAAADAFTDAVHGTAVDLGGSFSAEHGIGIAKAAELERYEPPAALAMMRAVKRALDPHGIMNPGKVLR